jgi:hypothetical protein
VLLLLLFSLSNALLLLLSLRRYGLMFKSVPRALFISLEDRGRVFRILKNWPERNVQLVRVFANHHQHQQQAAAPPGGSIFKYSVARCCLCCAGGCQ